MTHHSFTSKSALSGLLYFCFYLLPRIGAARPTTVRGAASAALCFGLKRCCGADGPLRMLVSVSHGARASPHALHLPRKAGKDVSCVSSSEKRCLDSQ